MGNMIKRFAGVRKDVTLVSLGWISFIASLLTPEPIVRAIFMAIARVLPKALCGNP